MASVGELGASKDTSSTISSEPLCGETGGTMLPAIQANGRKRSDWSDWVVGDQVSDSNDKKPQLQGSPPKAGSATNNAAVPPLKLPSAAQFLLSHAQTDRSSTAKHRAAFHSAPVSARQFYATTGFGSTWASKTAQAQTPRPFQNAQPAEAASLLQNVDPSLQSVAKRMSAALVKYYKERGVHVGMADNWSQFFADADKDGTGRMTLQELDEAVRVKLRANVSRFEIRVLWRRVDTNGSGLATSQEFVLLMYKISLSDWPDLSAQDIRRVVEVFNESVNRWHKAGGNWFKIFKHIDAEDSGKIGFDEFVRYVRGSLPGLRIHLHELSDTDLRGLWKAIDDDGSMDVTLNKFTVFMRKHGSALSMHKSPRQHKEKINITEALASASVQPLSEAQLGAVASRLREALQAWLIRQGMDGATSKLAGTSPRLWIELFDSIGDSRSNRISFVNFESCVKGKLRAGNKLPDDTLKSFWRSIDADCSGETSREEFIGVLYRLQMKSWPLLDDAALGRVVRVLNRAADHYYRCSGNWYKVFAKFDEDGSGTMEFDEMVAFLRRPLPGLRIPAKQLSDEEVQGLWRAIDADQSGKVTTREFTAFMRQHGKAFSMHKQARDKEEAPAEDCQPVPERSPEQLQNIARILERALAAYWKAQGVHQKTGNSSKTTYSEADWPGFFKECKFARRGKFTFSELSSSLDNLLRLASWKISSIEDLRALWVCTPGSTDGLVSEKEWCSLMYRLAVQTWPQIDKAGLVRIVDELDRAANQWHRAGGNWYKIFRIVDSDFSGSVSFDEVHKIVRAPLPCLAVTSDRITDNDLKGLWRAMDVDLSGLITVQEFMVFMRRHATKQIHQSPRQRNAALMAARRAETQTLVSLSEEQLRMLGIALSGQSLEGLSEAYKGWKISWSGMVTEWELLSIVRKVLRLSEEGFNDDAVDALWSSLDREGGGKIAASALLALGPELLDAMGKVS